MIKNIRSYLAEHKIDAMLITYDQVHILEQPPQDHLYLNFLAGFDGSAGSAIVTIDDAFIFVDDRYTLQVQQQVDTYVWTPCHIYDLKQYLHYPKIVVCNDNIKFSTLMSLYEKSNIQIIEHSITNFLPKTPDVPTSEEVFLHSNNYSGLNVKGKLHLVLSQLEDYDYYITSSPESICWLTNIRGRATLYVPIILSFAVLDISNKKIVLFANIDDSIDIDSQVIEVRPYQEFVSFFSTINGTKCSLDPKTNCPFVIKYIQDYHLIDCPINQAKSIKNKTEIANIIHAHVLDGIAVVKFLYWLEECTAQKTNSANINELKVAQYLDELRSQNKEFICPSFATISAFGSNGAIVHYHPNLINSKDITGTNLYLVDSGGQYLGGTTDITRTVAIGKNPSDEQKMHFTLVLKGHIALACAKFPKGTYGFQLDPIARMPLWQKCLDYAHGTGHGVGYCLNVHEGPQGISSNINNRTALKENMILSNEPGFYKPGEYGIRIESLVYVKEENSEFLGFETLSLVPIDRKLINISMLSQDEIIWINTYHQQIKEKLFNFLNEDEQIWLVNNCAPL